MTAAEILASESQERMCAVVTPDNVEKFTEICAHWDVTCAEIGEVTDNDHLVITHRGEVVVDAPAHTIAHQGPGTSVPGHGPRGRMNCNSSRASRSPLTCVRRFCAW